MCIRILLSVYTCIITMCLCVYTTVDVCIGQRVHYTVYVCVCTTVSVYVYMYYCVCVCMYVLLCVYLLLHVCVRVLLCMCVVHSVRALSPPLCLCRVYRCACACVLYTCSQYGSSHGVSLPHVCSM